MKHYFMGNPLSKDERGEILDLLPDNPVIRTVMYITGKEGALRASHYHLKDTHYCYVLSGEIKYNYQTKSKGEIHSVVLHEGDCVFTPTMEWHQFEFLTDGAFLAMATEARTQDSYETDTIRTFLP